MPDYGYSEKQPRPAAISKLIQYLDGNPVINNVSRTGPQMIHIEREEHSSLRVYLTNIYTVSESDLFEILSENPLVDAIVTMSAWNGYTSGAKEFCKERSIGLFKFKEF